MYFYKEQGKQHLDLTGDLIITHNRNIITARVPSAGPSKVKHAQYIEARKLNLMGKLRATVVALLYIWGKQPSIEEEVGNA